MPNDVCSKEFVVFETLPQNSKTVGAIQKTEKKNTLTSCQ